MAEKGTLPNLHKRSTKHQAEEDRNFHQFRKLLRKSMARGSVASSCSIFSSGLHGLSTSRDSSSKPSSGSLASPARITRLNAACCTLMSGCPRGEGPEMVAV